MNSSNPVEPAALLGYALHHLTDDTEIHFRHEPDPDNPGWWIWEVLDENRFNHILGSMRVRKETDDVARCRMWPEPRHSNLADVLHGGVVMTFIDVALFAGSRMLGVEYAGMSVTLDLSVQFIAPGAMDSPLDAEVEILRETRRLVFLRGLVVQGDNKIAGFSGTIRKPSSRR